MQIGDAPAGRADLIPAAIIGKRDMQWLMHIAQPVPEKLEGLSFGGIGCARVLENLRIGSDRGDHTGFRCATGRVGFSDCRLRARHVEEMLIRTLARTVGPRASSGEAAVMGIGVLLH